MNLSEVMAALASRYPSEDRMVPDRDRILMLMDLLGSPQKAYPSIHLTGTNGKTSTARMIDGLLRASGLKTGRYTSPHLDSVTERITLDGEPLPEERFVEVFEELAPLRPSWSTSARPYRCRSSRSSRRWPLRPSPTHRWTSPSWRSASAVSGTQRTWSRPGVAVVRPDRPGPRTAAGHDAGRDRHREVRDHLSGGDRRPRRPAARGRRGPAAPGRRGSVRPSPARASSSAWSAAPWPSAGSSSRCRASRRRTRTCSSRCTVRTRPPTPPPPSPRSRHCSAGAWTPRSSGRASPVPARPAGLEVVRSSPTVLVDAAHNAHGMAATATALADAFSFTTLVAVVACLADKDVRAMLEVLETAVTSIVVTENSSPRRLPVDALRELAEEIFGEDRVSVEDRLDDALDVAIGLADAAGEYGGAGVLVTGSVVTAGEARTLLKRR